MDKRLILINQSIATNMHIIRHSTRALSNPANDNQTIAYLQNAIHFSKQQITLNLCLKKLWNL